MAAFVPHAAAVVLSAFLFALVYPPFHVAPVAFLALTPVTMVFGSSAIRCSLPGAAAWGFAFGLLASMAIVGPWMLGAAIGYFEQGVAWSLGFTLAVNAAWVATFHAPLFVGIRLLAVVSPTLRILGTASLWIAFEALRAMEPFGNAWALLGQGLVGLPVAREAAAFGGAWLLGWLAALTGTGLGVALQPGATAGARTQGATVAFLSPLILVLLGTLAGGDAGNPTPLPPLRVAAVQAAIPGRDLWDPARRLEHLQRYFSATEALEPGKVDLVVWPESAIPFLLDTDIDTRERLSALATKTGASILLGAPRSRPAGDGRAVVYNSAWLFPPGGQAPQVYDKRRLLPFVETSPTPVAGPSAADYGVGDGSVLFAVGPWRIAPLICFEAIYPDYAAEAVTRGAHLLVNISNDAWFSAWAGPEQHHAMSVVRALESRRPMVRVANGGVSGAVTHDGTEIGITMKREAGVQLYQVPPPPRTETLASAQVDLVPWLASAVAIVAVVLAALGRHDDD